VHILKNKKNLSFLIKVTFVTLIGNYEAGEGLTIFTAASSFNAA